MESHSVAQIGVESRMAARLEEEDLHLGLNNGLSPSLEPKEGGSCSTNNNNKLALSVQAIKWPYVTADRCRLGLLGLLGLRHAFHLGANLLDLQFPACSAA